MRIPLGHRKQSGFILGFMTVLAVAFQNCGQEVKRDNSSKGVPEPTPSAIFSLSPTGESVSQASATRLFYARIQNVSDGLRACRLIIGSQPNNWCDDPDVNFVRLSESTASWSYNTTSKTWYGTFVPHQFSAGSYLVRYYDPAARVTLTLNLRLTGPSSIWSTSMNGEGVHTSSRAQPLYGRILEGGPEPQVCYEHLGENDGWCGNLANFNSVAAIGWNLDSGTGVWHWTAAANTIALGTWRAWVYRPDTGEKSEAYTNTLIE